jgi:hypothetical protein
VLASNSFVLSFQNLSVPSISLSSMSTPTPPPASPNRSSTPLQLTADEELEAFMREPTPMLLEGDEHRVGEEEQQGSTGPAASPGFESSATPLALILHLALSAPTSIVWLANSLSK